MTQDAQRLSYHTLWRPLILKKWDWSAIPARLRRRRKIEDGKKPHKKTSDSNTRLPPAKETAVCRSQSAGGEGGADLSVVCLESHAVSTGPPGERPQQDAPSSRRGRTVSGSPVSTLIAWRTQARSYFYRRVRGGIHLHQGLSAGRPPSPGSWSQG